MPADPRRSPYTNFNFLVQIGEVGFSGFSHLSGLESVIEAGKGEGGSGTLPRRDRVAHGNLVLRRGFDQRRDLWEWYRSVAAGRVDRRDLSIEVLDDEREPVVRIAVRGARPCRWRLSPLDAMEPAVLLEEIELEIEGFEID